MMLKTRSPKRRGAALVEYALLIAGVALIAVAAISVFGHKTSDLVAAVAAVLPGAHAEDNAAIQSGSLIETTAGAVGDPIAVDTVAILANTGTGRLGNNVLGVGSVANFGGLVTEAP